MNKKLNEKELSLIRIGYSRDGMSMADLACIYGVTRMQVWRILRGLSRKYEQRSFISPFLTSSRGRN